MYYQRYLWSICNRRQWPQPEYKAWQTALGHYCIVRVNNREYTTGLPFTTQAGAKENAAAQAWMICRAFSANDGMPPGQRPGQVAPNGFQQGKRVAIGEGRRKPTVPLPSPVRCEVQRDSLLPPSHRLSSSCDEDGPDSSPASSPRDSLRSSVGESGDSARSSMTSVGGISPKTSANNSANNSPRNSADNSPRDSVMEMSLLEGAEPLPQYGKPAKRNSYSKREKMCKCARGLPIKTYNRCEWCLAYLT